MINFYRKFLWGAARVLAPLTDALKGSGKSLSWSPAQDSTFTRPRFCSPPFQSLFILRLMLPSLTLWMLLTPTWVQFYNNSWTVLGLRWRSIPRSSLTRRRNTPVNCELLAGYSSLCHFRFMLEGREFTIFKNHKPLTHALFRVSPPWSAYQQRHLSYLAEFTSSIVHVPGPENVVADTLS